MLEHPDALQEGIRRLQVGDVSNAVLFLEAAVQKEPENPEVFHCSEEHKNLSLCYFTCDLVTDHSLSSSQV